MGKNYDYQVWQTCLGPNLLVPTSAFLSGKNSFCVPAQELFLYIINRFINKNMYYENTLQKKS